MDRPMKSRSLLHELRTRLNSFQSDQSKHVYVQTGTSGVGAVESIFMLDALVDYSMPLRLKPGFKSILECSTQS
jgi:hypothetical protein